MEDLNEISEVHCVIYLGSEFQTYVHVGVPQISKATYLVFKTFTKTRPTL